MHKRFTSALTNFFLFINLKTKTKITLRIFICKQKQQTECNLYASWWWPFGFKFPFGIRLLKECGEKLSPDTQTVEPFANKLNNNIFELLACWHFKGYYIYIIFNACLESDEGNVKEKCWLPLNKCLNVTATNQSEDKGVYEIQKFFCPEIFCILYLFTFTCYFNCDLFRNLY